MFCFKFISYIALTYYDINDETSKTEKQVNTSFVSTKIQFDLFRMRGVLMVKYLIWLDYQIINIRFFPEMKQNNKKSPKTINIIIMKRSTLIIFVSIIFFAISCLTYFGMFIFLKDQTTTVQNVTVTSEGPIRQVIKI